MNILEGNGIIVSADRPELTKEENTRRAVKFVHELIDIVEWRCEIIPVTGCYEGVQEQAYIISFPFHLMDDTKFLHDVSLDIFTAAYKMQQDAVIVYSPECARLLELPMVPSGEYTDIELRAAIEYLLLADEGRTLLSDPMYFKEITTYKAMSGHDYTEVNGRYYTLVY